ncbi:MAG: carboxymethylenebutenolidase [Pusillimonas sp.]|nr:carboxymethylenebutenolidase [Pusillimonas sp.]MBC41355.1 carboxymethylenebutenolidase [Pusillimonas sp.]HCP79329.1 carboxymethylenebutenolidase [Pusillimonas sp.]|tara:strand:- start:8132 stop:9013 length:882 start_codon:yes stop_codon:yes gene_type:complete
MNRISDADLDSHLPPLQLNRRGFMATALATGFTLAAGPLNAQSIIRTNTEGLTAGEIMIPVDGGEVPGYRAMPAGKENVPVILVVQEIFGVHEYIKDVCRRLAKQGYMAIAPELYARQGDPSKYKEIPKLFSEIVSKVPDTQVMSDLDASVKWAGSNGGNTQDIGITGFCWGGRIVWLYTAHNPNVKAGVAWYGRLVGDNTELTPKHPVDIAASLNGPVLGLYGGKDAGIPADTIEAMEAQLEKGNAAAKASKFIVYPDAPHAFHADYRPSYREEAAKAGWKEALEWFDTHLK